MPDWRLVFYWKTFGNGRFQKFKPGVNAVASENYSSERKAEFLLSNVIDEKDCEEAKKAVRELGLDPEKIYHYKPKTDAK